VSEPVVVAIDGPAGSGKSTVGRHVAERLGLEVLDTGAMYRAVTLLVLRAGIDPADTEQVAKVAEEARLVVGERVTCEGLDLTDELRTDDVNAAVSVVSANPAVRSVLVAQQREWVIAHGGGVVEGRDIGSVVFPEATVKVFLTASHEVRAERRPEEGPDGLARRDRLDKSRAASPLQPADGAHHVDTTDRPASEVAEEILGWL
jgi:cytidylate kinase